MNLYYTSSTTTTSSTTSFSERLRSWAGGIMSYRNTTEEDIHELQKHEKAMQTAFKKGGVTGVAKMINEQLDTWKTTSVNIAVIGRSGVGKSTFINVIRGVRPSDPTYAPVGENETTTEIKGYAHPSSEYFKFWDIPGMGTPSFPAQSYLKSDKIKFSSYDIYLLMSSESFGEYELELARALKRLKKPFFYVRTKVDVAIESERKRLQEQVNPRKFVQGIRSKLEDYLKDTLSSTGLYLIGCYDTNNEILDYSRLVERLIGSLEDAQRQVMLYSLNIMTQNLLEARISSLKKRIWIVGVLSGVTGAVPIPGVGLMADSALIAYEFKAYRSHLGITEDHLKSLANVLNVTIDELAKKYNLRSYFLNVSVRGLAGLFGAVGSEMVEESAKVTIPVFGSIIGAGVSFTTTTQLLRAGLDLMESDAHVVLKLFQENARGKIH